VPTGFYYQPIRLKQEAVSGNAWLISVKPQVSRDVLIRGGQEGWMLDPRARPYLTINCRVHLPSVWEGFATRETRVTAYPLAYPGDALHGFVPASFAVVYYFVSGAENLVYVGGHSWVGSVEANSPESARLIYTKFSTLVSWYDLSREGERDAIFVMIGALIALGAAMLVEAVRPFIDRYVERRRRGDSAGPA
jgi:hypothetical protein